MNFQVDTDLGLSNAGNSFRTEVSNPTLVIPAGVLTPGRQYTFSMTATNSVGGVGYSGKHRNGEGWITNGEGSIKSHFFYRSGNKLVFGLWRVFDAR